MRRNINGELRSLLQSFRDSEDYFVSMATQAAVINDHESYLYYRGRTDGICSCIEALLSIVDTLSDDCHGLTVASSGGR